MGNLSRQSGCLRDLPCSLCETKNCTSGSGWRLRKKGSSKLLKSGGTSPIRIGEAPEPRVHRVDFIQTLGHPFSDHPPFFLYWSCLVILPWLGLFFPLLMVFSLGQKKSALLKGPVFASTWVPQLSPRRQVFLQRTNSVGHVVISGIDGVMVVLC